MSLKIEIEGVMFNVVNSYAPQVRCELEEKEEFWSDVDESITRGERVVIGADFGIQDRNVEAGLVFRIGM